MRSHVFQMFPGPRIDCLHSVRRGPDAAWTQHTSATEHNGPWPREIPRLAAQQAKTGSMLTNVSAGPQTRSRNGLWRMQWSNQPAEQGPRSVGEGSSGWVGQAARPLAWVS